MNRYLTCVAKDLMRNPAPTTTAMLGKFHPAGRQSFGNLPGFIYTQKEEGNAAFIWPTEGCKAVAKLFEIGCKTKDLNVCILVLYGSNMVTDCPWLHGV